METAKKISKKLNDYMIRKDDMKIAGWLFHFQEGQSISIGLYNNKIGGPYAQPQAEEKRKGEAYIRWADGRVSNIKMNASSLEDLDASLNEWKASSYLDEDAPEIIKPLPTPQNLKIKDDKVVDLITKDSSYIFEVLKFYNNELGKKSYTKTVKAEISAEHLNVTIMNSEGLSLEWEETDTVTGGIVNDKAWDMYHERKLPGKKDLKSIVKELDRYMAYADKVVSVKKGKMPIIITPRVLHDFLDKYVKSNVDGQVVANNQSIYSIEDFETKKQVFNEQINWVIDGLKDYSSSTLPCSGEGVPSNKQNVIAGGRLITPLLNLKYAKKTGFQPTPAGKLHLEILDTIPYNKMISGIDYGLIVYGVLGMHTQDQKMGNYSLTVEPGLLVENGKITGAVSGIVIKGNFFDALKDKNTKFSKYRKDSIAMRTEAEIKSKK